MLAQHQDSLQPPRASGLGVGKRWGGDITKAAYLNRPKGYPILCGVTLKNKNGQGEGGHLIWRCLFSQTTATCIEALIPRTWPNVSCWWEVENNWIIVENIFSPCFHMAFTCFSLFLFPLIKSLLSQTLRSLCCIFSPFLLEEGEWEWPWWNSAAPLSKTTTRLQA